MANSELWWTVKRWLRRILRTKREKYKRRPEGLHWACPSSQLLTKWAEMEEGISFLTGTIVFTNINQSYLWDVRLMLRLSCIWNQGLLSICVELRIMSLLRFELRIMMSLLRWPSLSSFRETARRVKSGRVRSNVRSQSSWRWSSLALWDWRLER